VLARQHRDLRDLFAAVSDPDVDRAAVWLRTVKQVATHVAVERTFVYPLVKHSWSGSGPLANDLLDDYKKMEHLLVLTERRKINSPDLPQLVTELLHVFQGHQQRCERLLSPSMTEQLTQVELVELGAKMRGAENVILSHPHPHLLVLGPVYQWTTRVASRWDRFRDRLVRNR
jgi:hypothetical protein